MRKALTAKFIQAVTNSNERRLEVWDLVLPGFGVRVSKTNKKSWFVIVRAAGRQRRITLGNYPTFPLAEARERARQFLHDAQAGMSPSLDRCEQAETLGEIVPKFIELHAKQNNRGWKESERLLQKFEELFDRPIKSIKRADVIRILDTVVASGTPYRANRALASLKKLFSWALDRGIVDVNPIQGLHAPAREIARERILSDGELTHLLNLAYAMGYPFGPIFLVLIFTGQRRGEVTGMLWSEIDFASCIWTIPAGRSKNGKSHGVPLSDPLLAVLRSLPRFLGSDHVFTTTGTSPVSGFGRVKKRLDIDMQCFDWRIHDIRRTVASGMARLGVAPYVVEKVLNHQSGIVSGVAAVYNRYGYEKEKREALDSWAGFLKSLISADVLRDHESSYLVQPAGGSEPSWEKTPGTQVA